MRRSLMTAVSFVMLLFLFGCSVLGVNVSDAAGPTEVGFPVLPDINVYPSNVVIGVSGPYSTKERMVEEAILGCARLVALSEALAVDNRVVTQWDSKKGLRSFATEGNAYFDDSSLAEIIGRLVILEIIFDKEAVAVVVACDGTHKPDDRPYVGSLGPDGKPQWLTNIPKSEAYRFGVGSSGSYRFLNDSLEAADFEAAQNLLDRHADQLYAKGFTKTVQNQTETRMETGIYQASKALLQGFMVVSRYHDQETNTYWSLVAVPK